MDYSTIYTKLKLNFYIVILWHGICCIRICKANLKEKTNQNQERRDGMKRFIIATHGTMAQGMKTSIELVCGEQQNIDTICCYTKDGSDIEGTFEAIEKQSSDDDVLIICVDMFYGSVAQRLVPYLSRKNTYMIAGINLPIMLELVFFEGDFSKSAIEKCVHAGLEQMFFVDVEKMQSSMAENVNDFLEP